MERYKVKKIKTRNLSEMLRAMKPGDEAFFSDREFRIASIYACCYRMKRKEGLSFSCSAKMRTGGCKVTRLK